MYPVPDCWGDPSAETQRRRLAGLCDLREMATLAYWHVLRVFTLLLFTAAGIRTLT
ncbi:hypothetical protein LU604_26555 (plasmid) [Erwinia tracheiphila]|uniref:hypothetical protein n=1 Tax=Erwinia tracheiphila TaxID=65700 RepID=UPI001F3CF36A|nr:hypothetical protein [Erwinia tracheiphila]UIA86020.1 hypothetical protein LU604_26555 [Erwinia tracheiphila]